MAPALKAKQAKPEAGDYLENGTRLVRVLSYTSKGKLLVEDCATDKTDELASTDDWRPVRRKKRGN